VDNVQVNYVQKRDDTTSSRVRFYEILEWLDALQELQREGCVRSFSGRNFSPGLLRLCHEHSFPVVSNQVDANLLDPTALSNSELNLACSDLKMPLTVSGPLAGGWLTDRFALPPPQQRRQWSSEPPPLPPPWKFTQSERLHFERGLRDVWTAGHGIETGSDGTVWKAYHAKLLPVLQHVARKHGVSISTVVLRWTLQLDEVASAVVTTSLQREDSLSKRRQELRDVFRFELDDQDMKQMWDVSGQPSKPAPVDAEVDEEAFLQLKEEMKEKENGLYVPRKGLAGVKKATDLDLATLSKFRF
jgi:aryl-alcohol dehydrogenase-like predicted oxidoreductase